MRKRIRRKWSLLQRFEKKYIPEPNSGCWLWTGSVDLRGYGKIGIDYKTVTATHAAHELFIGPVAEGSHVLHTCDTPACVNPQHLYVGTHWDNMADKVRRGRSRKGSEHPLVKLTENDIRMIRHRFAAGEHRGVLANAYNISRGNVYAIAERRTWRHLS